MLFSKAKQTGAVKLEHAIRPTLDKRRRHWLPARAKPCIGRAGDPLRAGLGRPLGRESGGLAETGGITITTCVLVLVMTCGRGVYKPCWRPSLLR